jgi:hypothetical protein
MYSLGNTETIMSEISEMRTKVERLGDLRGNRRGMDFLVHEVTIPLLVPVFNAWKCRYCRGFLSRVFLKQVSTRLLTPNQGGFGQRSEVYDMKYK